MLTQPPEEHIDMPFKGNTPVHRGHHHKLGFSMAETRSSPDTKSTDTAQTHSLDVLLH